MLKVALSAAPMAVPAPMAAPRLIHHRGKPMMLRRRSPSPRYRSPEALNTRQSQTLNCLYLDAAAPGPGTDPGIVATLMARYTNRAPERDRAVERAQSSTASSPLMSVAPEPLVVGCSEDVIIMGDNLTAEGAEEGNCETNKNDSQQLIIPRGPVQQSIEDRIFTPTVSAVFSTVRRRRSAIPVRKCSLWSRPSLRHRSSGSEPSTVVSVRSALAVLSMSQHWSPAMAPVKKPKKTVRERSPTSGCIGQTAPSTVGTRVGAKSNSGETQWAPMPKELSLEKQGEAAPPPAVQPSSSSTAKQWSAPRKQINFCEVPQI
ncbi:hypothetical protein UY3_12818 [Chelonia mydas]|uniref:Uncharacterized protein n=1 Tax=Chelonia mydas TaxID=8469 RepID=M7BD39_CHEMY|nr:hypothetical protein UY3_12818 [Chelonia mydas]